MPSQNFFPYAPKFKNAIPKLLYRNQILTLIPTQNTRRQPDPGPQSWPSPKNANANPKTNTHSKSKLYLTRNLKTNRNSLIFKNWHFSISYDGLHDVSTCDEINKTKQAWHFLFTAVSRKKRCSFSADSVGEFEQCAVEQPNRSLF